MVPFAMFSVLAEWTDGRTEEISAMDLSFDSFTFRIAAGSRWEEDPARFRVFIRGLQHQESILLEYFSLTLEERSAEYILYRVQTEDTSFINASRQLMREFTEYTRLKNEAPDALLSERLTGYPSREEKRYAPDFRRWVCQQLEDLRADETWYGIMCTVPELAVCAGFPESWKALFHRPLCDVWQAWLEEYGLAAHPLMVGEPTHLYIGNAYCANLFPEKEELRILAKQCGQQGITPVFQLAPMSEGLIPLMTRRLQELHAIFGGVELIVQDTGIPELLRELGLTDFRLTAGPPLVRRRKDPRMRWWLGNTERLAQCSANSSGMQAWYASLGITRLSWEACGYPLRTTPDSDLRLPFYQVNTATHCTLDAVCRTGRRGCQTMGECGNACERLCFLYGDALQTVGRGNTLYGLDTRSLTDGAYLSGLIQPGVNRLVIDLLQEGCVCG